VEKNESFSATTHSNTVNSYNCLLAHDELIVDWSERRRLQRE